jgi:hypothetical protein
MRLRLLEELALTPRRDGIHTILILGSGPIG